MKYFIMGLIILGLTLGVTSTCYGGSTKLEDESGKGSILNEDNAHSSGDPGIVGLSVRKDTAASVSGTDGDYQPLITASDGKLHTKDQYISTSTIISSTKLDDDPTSVNSTNIAGGKYDKVVVVLTLDETDSGNDTSGAVSVDISYDNSTWITDVGFYNATDPTSNVVSISTNSGANTDENVAIIIDTKMLSAPYIRVQVTGTGTASGGDDEITVVGYLATQ